MTLELSIAKLGLRASVVDALARFGITQCYPWQAAALREAVPDGANFVYTAPTSGGKSLVADILMFRRLQASIDDWKKPRAKALVLVPYLSIGVLQAVTPRDVYAPEAASPPNTLQLSLCAVSERGTYLKKLCAKSKLRVKSYTANESGCPLVDPKENIAVCSYEKGNSAVNKLIAGGQIGQLCCIIVDEFHMLADEGRGPALEVCFHWVDMWARDV